ncbi:c-type cytochrome [Achromobacter xylosoxidans]
MRAWCIVALTLAAVAAGVASSAAALIYLGWYDVSATSPHTVIVHRLMDTALARSVRARSADVRVPDLERPERLRNGSSLYRAHCAQCHGAPGVAPQPYALGLNPAPAALVATARQRTAADIFWITRQGIKMTGMPAWQYRLSDDEIWDVVAFLRILPTLSPAQYRNEDAGPPASPPSTRAGAGAARIGDPAAGREAMHQHLCAACHAIPGVTGAWNHVGPPLAGMADRPYIAGVMLNTPDNLERWLRQPGAIKPGTAMPDLEITAQDARDMAAFLHTLSESGR